MSGMRTRAVATTAVLGVAALSIALGVSLSRAQEPKGLQLDQRVVPRHVTPGGPINPAEISKADEQMFRALNAWAKAPNDADARKRLNEAQQMMMQVLGSELPALDIPSSSHIHGRPRLGAWLEPLTPLVTDQLGLETGKGVAIAGVIEGSAAEKAGFKAHDIVVEFAGKPVTDPADFTRQVSAIKSGEKVDAVVVRKGKRVELKGIDLPAPPPMNPKATAKSQANDSVSVSVSNGAFTIQALEEGTSYLITGQVGADGATADKVSIKAGQEKFETEDLSKVPAKYRQAVEGLLKLVGKPGGNVID